MTVEEKVSGILSKYESKFDLIMAELRSDLEDLVGIEGVAVNVTVGEARKIAILKACSHYPNLKKQILSQIAQAYGKLPGGVGVYFRPDVGLMARAGANARKITDKGLELVREYDELYGNEWEKSIEKTLADSSVTDSTKIKLRLKKVRQEDFYDKGARDHRFP